MKTVADIPDIGSGRIVGLIKLLETEKVGVLFGNQVKHAPAMAGGAGFFRYKFIPATNIPGHHPNSVGLFGGKIFFCQAHAKESMDILPADEQGEKGNEGPSPGYEEPEKEKSQQQRKEQGEYKSKQGNEPPFIRMKKGITAGEQK